jgi:Domain of unknown function (DUF4365)
LRATAFRFLRIPTVEISKRDVLTPWHGARVAKKATNQAVIGETGVHLIARIVDEMGHLWEPTSGVDSGIDGQIELRDPATTEVRNVRIGVQSKASTVGWDRETDAGFSYRPTPKDIAYWLSSNQPVLLICSRAGQAYWRSVQEWARDPKARSKGYLRFDKDRDRFDASAASRLFDLKTAPDDWAEPPGAAPVPERLLTNLMPVEWRTAHLWSAAVPGGAPRDVLSPAWEKGLEHRAGVLSRQRYWSFARFDELFLQAICASDVSKHDLAGLVSGTAQDANVLRELLIRELVSRHDELRWHAYKKVAYFRRREVKRNVEYSWTKGRPRTVVNARFSKEEDRHFSDYRHDAAELTTRDLGDGWAVQVTPTYLFTWDGVQLSGHHDKALAGIKRLDKHRAVSSALRMWQHLFVDQPTLEAPDLNEFFGLLPLQEAEVPFSVRDSDWAEMSEQEAFEAQDSFFDFEDAEL